MSKFDMDIGGNAIVYSYPGGDYDIICASNRVFVPAGWEAIGGGDKPAPAPRQAGKKSEGDDCLRSMRRARAKVRRLALANDFDVFVTLTLDRAKIDRYDPGAIMARVNKWLGNMVARHGLRYILVPEQHKDGAYHYHGFFAGAGLALVDSGHQDKGGHTVYNLPQWGYGYSTAVRLYGSYSQAVGYVCKYIGKQDGDRPMGRWYYSGGGLREPDKTYATLDYRGLAQEYQGEAVTVDVPGCQLLVVHHRADNQSNKAD